jgi:hypothetical protein
MVYTIKRRFTPLAVNAEDLPDQDWMVADLRVDTIRQCIVIDIRAADDDSAVFLVGSMKPREVHPIQGDDCPLKVGGALEHVRIGNRLIRLAVV